MMFLTYLAGHKEWFKVVLDILIKSLLCAPRIIPSLSPVKVVFYVVIRI